MSEYLRSLRSGAAWTAAPLSALVLGLVAISAMQLACAPSLPAAAPTAVAGHPVSKSISANSTASPAPAPTGGAQPSPVARPPLMVEEYPVAAQGTDEPTHMEYRKLIPSQALDVRQQWRAQGTQSRLPRVVQALSGAGYRIETRERATQSPLYDLYKGVSPVLTDLSEIWSVSTSASGADFALIVEDERGRESLVRRDGVQPWDEGRHVYVRPVFVGDDLTWIERIDSPTAEQYAVVKGGQRVQMITVTDQGVDIPIKGLAAWTGQWVVEVRGQVYVGGRSLNQELGADEVFGWRLIDGRPFYFFVKDGQVRVSFDGAVLPQTYEQVVHYRCCEPAMFNVGGNDSMVWFHALRAGTWHYVEMGVYDLPLLAVTAPTEGRQPTASAQASTSTPAGSPALRRGGVEDARKQTGLPVRVPKYLPAGAQPDGYVSFVPGERAMTSLGYRTDSATFEVRFARSDPAAAESRGELVDLGPRKAVYVAHVKGPTDQSPAVGRVGWLDGDTFTSVIGALPKDELMKIAASLVAEAPVELLSSADLGKGWVEGSVATPAPANGRVRRLFRWGGPEAASPEGFREIVYEVETHPDAANARAALSEPLPSGDRLISGPEVGDASRYYSLAQDGMTGVVAEAVRGTVRVRVGVLGAPQSQVKETRAAELARLALSRAAVP